MTSYLQNWKSYQPQVLHQQCFYSYNGPHKVLFQSVDVNFDFFSSRPLSSPPPGPFERLKRPGLIALIAEQLSIFSGQS